MICPLRHENNALYFPMLCLALNLRYLSLHTTTWVSFLQSINLWARGNTRAKQWEILRALPMKSWRKYLHKKDLQRSLSHQCLCFALIGSESIEYLWCAHKKTGRAKPQVCLIVQHLERGQHLTYTVNAMIYTNC